MESTLGPGVRRLPDASSIQLKRRTAKSITPKQAAPELKEAAQNNQPSNQSRVEAADGPVEPAMLNVQESSPRTQYAQYSRNAGNQPVLMHAVYRGTKPRQATARPLHTAT